MAIVSVNAYAKLKGLHVSTIQEKIKKGLISDRALVKGKGRNGLKVNTEIADLELEFTIGDQPPKEESDKYSEKREEIFQEVSRHRKVKITHEELKSRKLELEVAELEGRLLDIDQVRERIVKLVTESREALLNMPARIAPHLVSITDVVEMENKLTDEINLTLESLSRLEK